MCDIPNPIKSNNIYKEERENNNLKSFNNLNNKLFNFNEKSELSTLYTKNYNSLSQFNKKKLFLCGHFYKTFCYGSCTLTVSFYWVCFSFENLHLLQYQTFYQKTCLSSVTWISKLVRI